MARGFTDAELKHAPKKPGIRSDGNGLYLRTGKSLARKWLYIYTANGKRTEINLGGYPAVSIAEARRKARELTGKRQEGADPKTTQAAAKPITFADTYAAMSEAQAAMKRPHYRAFFDRKVVNHTASIADRKITSITRQDCVDVLARVNETAPSFLRPLNNALEKTFEYARVMGLYSGDNPARYKHGIEFVQPRVSRRDASTNHPAMPYQDVPKFYAWMMTSPRDQTRAFALTILLAARSHETREARWREIDLDARVFTLPASRSKTHTRMRFPLSDAAVAILQHQAQYHGTAPDDLVFRGRFGTAVQTMTFGNILRSAGAGDFTAHGMRTSFKAWCRATGVDWELSELSLQHAVGNAVSRAYDRGDLLDERRELMQRWADFVTGAATAENGQNADHP